MKVIENVDVVDSIKQVFRTAKQNLQTEAFIPMRTDDGVETLADFRKRHTKYPSTYGVKINLNAILKPWSFAEWSSIKDRIFTVMKSFGYDAEVYHLFLTHPPLQNYCGSLGAMLSGGEEGQTALRAVESGYETAIKKWHITMRDPKELDEKLYNSTGFVQVQIGVKGHWPEFGYPWLFLMKETPKRLKISFYQNSQPVECVISKEMQNKYIIDEFCKPSFRYQLSSEIFPVIEPYGSGSW